MQNGQMNYQKPINYQNEQLKSFAHKYGKHIFFYGILFILLLVLLNECFYVVGENEQAVVSRFGVIKSIVINSRNDFHEKYADQLKNEITASGNVKIVVGSGLQWKFPFVDKVDKYSSKLFTYISESELVNTSEKKQYYFTTMAQWYIADPALFNLKIGSMTSARNQLDNEIPPKIVQAINRMTAEDFVSNKEALNSALADKLKIINDEMCLRGIEVKDIQVHRTTLPQANIDSTYARMQADRAKVAQQLRSEGQEKYQNAVASADLEARKLEADATSEAGRIRGEGDAASLEIYAKSYGKDEEFFSYWRSLQALEKSLDQNSTLVLDKNHPLWSDLLTWATQK
jgi:membrane protease subunit HflC